MRFHQRTSRGAPVISPGNVIFRATLLRAMCAGHTHSITSSIPQGSMPNRKNTYELTYIVNAVLNDDQIKGVVNRIAEYIKEEGGTIDRKSTRLNSSHVADSYAVFCLKKNGQQVTKGHLTLQANTAK